jgi:hypothetical protein
LIARRFLICVTQKFQKWTKLHSLNDNIAALNPIKIRRPMRIIILGLVYFQNCLSLTSRIKKMLIKALNVSRQLCLNASIYER